MHLYVRTHSNTYRHACNNHADMQPLPLSTSSGIVNLVCCGVSLATEGSFGVGDVVAAAVAVTSFRQARTETQGILQNFCYEMHNNLIMSYHCHSGISSITQLMQCNNKNSLSLKKRTIQTKEYM